MASRRPRSDNDTNRYAADDEEKAFLARQEKLQRGTQAIRDASATLQEKAAQMAQHPESKFGNALVASMRQYDYNVLMDIRVPMERCLPSLLSDAGMPPGTKGTVHVTADREIVVILEGHAEALREGALRTIAHRIVQLDAAGVSGLRLKRASLILLGWGGTYDNAGSDAVGLLRPHLPEPIASTLRALTPWVYWDNPMPYSYDRASRLGAGPLDGYRQPDEKYIDEISVEGLRLGLSAGNLPPIRCSGEEDARWIVGISSLGAQAARCAAFVDVSGSWRVIQHDSTIGIQYAAGWQNTYGEAPMPETGPRRIMRSLRRHAELSLLHSSGWIRGMDMELVRPASFEEAKRIALNEPYGPNKDIIELTVLVVIEGEYCLATLDSLRHTAIVDMAAERLGVVGVPEIVAGYAGGGRMDVS